MTMQHAYALAAKHAQGLPLRSILAPYKILPATSSDEMIKGFSLRHDIYCSEKNIENANFSGIEKDAFDKHSTQLILSKGTKHIGCVRFVHGKDEEEFKELPIERYGHGKLDYRYVSNLKLSKYKYAEISRLGISKKSRGVNSVFPAKGLFGASAPLLTMLTGIMAYARISDTRYLFAMVEPDLMKRLFKLHIPLITIGEPIDYHGKKIPILMDREQIHVPLCLWMHYNRIYEEINAHLEKSSVLMPTPQTIPKNLKYTVSNDTQVCALE